MGHLLGTAPPAAGRPRAVVSTSPCAVDRTYTVIDAVRTPAEPDARILAYSVDAPRLGNRLPGCGIELDGWVIAADEQVAGLSIVINNASEIVVPLDVPRPDVAADYPMIFHAAASGFTAWAPLSGSSSHWVIEIRAILAGGAQRPLAQISGALQTTSARIDPDMRGIDKPDFVIIGAQRGGTTSLHAYLSEHPDVVTPVKKELHFLTDRHSRGQAWYQGQFPQTVARGTVVGEATPYALFHPAAPARLHAIAPQARLIALLRNPVDRAYSHYLLEKSRGHEPLSFAAAIAAESERLTGIEEQFAIDPTFVSLSHKRYSYVSRGEYAAQLERWLALFPREQMLIVPSEALYLRPAEIMERVTQFLGIQSATRAGYDVHNPTSGPSLDPDLRRQLSAHYVDANHRLQQLLGWESIWGAGL